MLEPVLRARSNSVEQCRRRATCRSTCTPATVSAPRSGPNNDTDDRRAIGEVNLSAGKSFRRCERRNVESGRPKAPPGDVVSDHQPGRRPEPTPPEIRVTCRAA